MVEENLPQVIWGKRAFKSLEKAYERIKEESLANAEMVREDILKATRELSKSPERYPPDKFKRENQRSEFRAFEKHSYRIAYRYTGNQIKIVRLRHVRQEPVKY